MKLSTYAITQALWACDPAILNGDLVEKLIKIMPEEAEANCFVNCDIQREKLAIPDLFFLEIIKVPAYDARLFSL
jgi:hypothetical protein